MSDQLAIPMPAQRPASQTLKAATHALIVALRKQGFMVYRVGRNHRVVAVTPGTARHARGRHLTTTQLLELAQRTTQA